MENLCTKKGTEIAASELLVILNHLTSETLRLVEKNVSSYLD